RARGGRVLGAVEAIVRGRWGRWGVACSGGVDSLALLLCLGEVLGGERGRVWVLHFDHGVREASAAEARWVQGVAEELGFAFRGGRWAEGHPNADEAELRAARRSFLLEAASSLGLEVLLTGHHLDDVLESFFLRLGRGSGLAALAAPAAERGEVLPNGQVVSWLRPFLEISREEIEGAMRAAGVSWLTDASNEDVRFTRNALRAQVIPPWKAAIPQDWRKGVVRAHRLLREDATALDGWAERVGRAAGRPDGSLKISELAGLPRAILRRILEPWLRGHPGMADLRASAVEGFLDWVQGALAGEAGTVHSIGGFTFTLHDGGLRGESVGALPALADWSAERSDAVCVFSSTSGARLRAEVVILSDTVRDQILAGAVDTGVEAWLDVASVGVLSVRAWQPGDRYRPLGAPGSKKLQDAFVDRGIPAAERGRLPVVLGEGAVILWVPGLLPAEVARIRPGGNSALRLTYHRPSAKVV
ncbi:MAG: tRNA lysidine(34) synthetase TilS, partial [Opitutales bacterium]|nr:tRNA lysidine(34) synthetase TilS [Opitutales bacterium]